MNGDPYARTSQSSDRRVINRSGSAAYRPTDEPQPPREEPPKSAPRSSGSRRSERDNSGKGSNRGLLWTIVIVLILIALSVVGWLVWSNSKNAATGIDSSRYQAVFLSNGQIYFGKLSAFNDESFKITSVYYPQAQETGNEAETTNPNQQSVIQLFPIVEGVHGPEDEMIIMKNQILYYENLRSDSEVTRRIEQNKN